MLAHSQKTTVVQHCRNELCTCALQYYIIRSPCQKAFSTQEQNLHYWNLHLPLHRITTIPAITNSNFWSCISHELPYQSSTPSTICNLFSSTTSSVPQQGSPIWTTKTWQSLQYSWLHPHSQQLLWHFRQLDWSRYGHLHGTQSNHTRRACTAMKFLLTWDATCKLPQNKNSAFLHGIWTVHEDVRFSWFHMKVIAQEICMNKLIWVMNHAQTGQKQREGNIMI